MIGAWHSMLSRQCVGYKHSMETPIRLHSCGGRQGRCGIPWHSLIRHLSSISMVVLEANLRIRLDMQPRRWLNAKEQPCHGMMSSPWRTRSWKWLQKAHRLELWIHDHIILPVRITNCDI